MKIRLALLLPPLLIILAGCPGPRPAEPDELVSHLPDCDLTDDESARLALADSLGIAGEFSAALAENAALIREAPDCSVLRVRRGDLLAMAGRERDAAMAYDAALEREPCVHGARAGRVRGRLPRGGLSHGLLVELGAELTDALEHCPYDAPLWRLLWRVRLLDGDRIGSRAALDGLGDAALGPGWAAALELARNLVPTLPEGAIYISGSQVETDALLLSLAQAGGRPDVLVVEPELLDEPRAVLAYVAEGLPLDLGAGEIRRLEPRWSREIGRRLTVREQVVRSIIAAAGERVCISPSWSEPVVYDLRPQLQVAGLFLAFGNTRGGVAVKQAAAHLLGADLTALEEWSIAAASRSSGLRVQSLRERSELTRLLDRYPETGLKVAAAALREGRITLGNELLAFTEHTAALTGADARIGEQLAAIRAHGSRP